MNGNVLLGIGVDDGDRTVADVGVAVGRGGLHQLDGLLIGGHQIVAFHGCAGFHHAVSAFLQVGEGVSAGGEVGVSDALACVDPLAAAELLQPERGGSGSLGAGRRLADGDATAAVGGNVLLGVGVDDRHGAVADVGVAVGSGGLHQLGGLLVDGDQVIAVDLGAGFHHAVGAFPQVGEGIGAADEVGVSDAHACVDPLAATALLQPELGGGGGLGTGRHLADGDGAQGVNGNVDLFVAVGDGHAAHLVRGQVDRLAGAGNGQRIAVHLSGVGIFADGVGAQGQEVQNQLTVHELAVGDGLVVAVGAGDGEEHVGGDLGAALVNDHVLGDLQAADVDEGVGDGHVGVGAAVDGFPAFGNVQLFHGPFAGTVQGGPGAGPGVLGVQFDDLALGGAVLIELHEDALGDLHVLAVGFPNLGDGQAGVGDLAADAGNQERDLPDGTVFLRNAEIGIAVGGIILGGAVFVGLLKAFGRGVQSDGIGQSVGVGDGAAFGGNDGVGRIQRPLNGIAFHGNAAARHGVQDDELAHGVGDGGAGAVHAVDGRVGDVGEGCADGGAVAAAEGALCGAGDVFQQIILRSGRAVAYGVNGGAAVADLGGDLPRGLGVVTAGGAVDLLHAGAFLGVRVGGAVAQQDQILGTGVDNFAHAQAVAAQHQAAVNIGAAAGIDRVDLVFQGLQIGRVLDVQPLADLVRVFVELDHGYVDLAGVGGGQTVQEAAFLGQDRLDGFQAGIVGASPIVAVIGALVHGGGVVDDQLDRRVTGGDGLGGDDLQRDVECVQAGLRDGLGEGVAAVGDGGLGGVGHGAVLGHNVTAAHDLIGIGIHGQGADLTHAHQHAQGQQDGHCFSKILLCHYFVLLSLLGERNIGGRAGVASLALARLLCVPPFRMVCHLSNISR